MENTLTAATLKRRGMATIGEGLRHGPVHIIKRNTPAAVVLPEEQYRRLSGAASQPVLGMTAPEWRLSQPGLATRDRKEIDESLASGRVR